MPLTSYEPAWLIEQRREWRRKNRRFNIIAGSVCGVLVLLFVALVWVLVATEPERRAAYMADCQRAGFTPEQCKFFYAERGRQEADNAVAFGLAATALAVGAARR
jgi:hypothetical protein